MNHFVSDPSLSHHKQHKLQAKHTFFGIEEMFPFLPDVNSSFISQQNCYCVIFSPISLRGAASPCSTSLEELTLPGWDGLQFR